MKPQEGIVVDLSDAVVTPLWACLRCCSQVKECCVPTRLVHRDGLCGGPNSHTPSNPTLLEAGDGEAPEDRRHDIANRRCCYEKHPLELSATANLWRTGVARKTPQWAVQWLDRWLSAPELVDRCQDGCFFRPFRSDVAIPKKRGNYRNVLLR